RGTPRLDLRETGAALEDLRLRGTGRNDVDADPSRQQLCGQNARHLTQPGLGGRIDHIPGQGQNRTDRAGDDDTAAVAQMRKRRLHRKERTSQVDAVHAIPELLRDLVYGSKAADSG